MATHKIKLRGRTEVAFDTMAFHFEKPAGFTFIPGQAGDFILENPPENDKEGNKRSFSLASAPYEDDLFITTRMRDSAFKRSLRKVPLGTELTLDGPWGELVLDKDHTTPAVLLTGGIGITPMRSIILQAAHDKLPQKIMLFYSNHKPEDTAFLSDLHKAAQQNSNFTFIPTMTKMHESLVTWDGETGKIDETLLKKHLRSIHAPTYYITGPPGLVSGMQKMLHTAGVKDKNVRAEEFSGY